MVPASVHLIRRTYEDLAGQDDLSPKNPIVNERLSGLVRCLADAQCNDQGLLLGRLAELHELRQALPRLCGRAECEMEGFWARRFLAKASLVVRDLEEFWYYANYTALWTLERTLLGTLAGERLVFLGSGSLPLTAIMAAMERGTGKVACVDLDPVACELSSRLIGVLGLAHRMTVHLAAAQEYVYRPQDVVLCASLIQGKAELYERLFESGVETFLVRDAEGAYCFLYEPSPLPNPVRYQAVGHTIPTPTCINTTRLFQRLCQAGAEIMQEPAVDVLQVA
jgi:hypothetical protein